MLATSPCGASSNIALWRAKIKPPVELVVGDLDNDIPTILFGLDMFYLPYHQNFYHTRHILGHVVLMVGYDEINVYVHDNSKVGVQTIP